MSLRPDLAVVSECATPERLEDRGADWIEGQPLWVGSNPNKGLGIFAFNGYAVERHEPYHPNLRFIAPARVSGPLSFTLLAVWAQNASAGITRKHQLGPLRRALSKYRDLLSAGPAVVAGDFNNNVFWDRPGWRINHKALVEKLEALGLVSAYHAIEGEAQGRESRPTIYWRDRKRDGPTYHIDYIFLPEAWIDRVRAFSVGRFEDWVGNGLSDHVPLTVEVDL